jgi:hypothetical protein
MVIIDTFSGFSMSYAAPKIHPLQPLLSRRHVLSGRTGENFTSLMCKKSQIRAFRCYWNPGRPAYMMAPD